MNDTTAFKSGARQNAPATTYLSTFLPNGVSHLMPKELASACGYSSQHILASIDSGHLGAFQIPGRGVRRCHARIPVALAHAYLLSNSTGLEDALVLDQFARALAALPLRLRQSVLQSAATLSG